MFSNVSRDMALSAAGLSSAAHLIAQLHTGGSGRPQLAVAHSAQISLWTAATSVPDTLHIFQRDSLQHIVRFPEDIYLLQSAVGHPRDGRQWFLVITVAGRAWLLSPAPGQHAQQDSSVQVAEPAAASGVVAIAQADIADEELRLPQLQLQWQELERTAHPASSSPQHCSAPARQAALLLPPACVAGFEPAGCACLAAQAVWAHLESTPADTPSASLFHDLSQLDRQHSAACASPFPPSAYTAQAWAASELPPQLGSFTSMLHVTPAGSASSSSSLACSSRAVLHAQLYAALLSRHGHTEHVASAAGCLLAGNAQGRVWAMPLGSHAALREAGSGRRVIVPAADSSPADTDGAHQQPLTALLFDLQQPVLAILADGTRSSGSEPCDRLLIVGQGGQVIQLSARLAAPAQGQPGQAPAVQNAKPPALAVQRLRIPAPVSAAAVADGVLYFTAGGVAHAAALPGAPPAREGSAAVGSRGAALQELPAVALPGMGQGAYLLAVAQPSGSGCGGELVALCSSGCLLRAPLLPAHALRALQPRLTAAEAQAKAKVSSCAVCMLLPCITVKCMVKSQGIRCAVDRGCWRASMSCRRSQPCCSRTWTRPTPAWLTWRSQSPRPR
jgi:hypothetical protein